MMTPDYSGVICYTKKARRVLAKDRKSVEKKSFDEFVKDLRKQRISATKNYVKNSYRKKYAKNKSLDEPKKYYESQEYKNRIEEVRKNDIILNVIEANDSASREYLDKMYADYLSSEDDGVKGKEYGTNSSKQAVEKYAATLRKTYSQIFKELLAKIDKAVREYVAELTLADLEFIQMEDVSRKIEYDELSVIVVELFNNHKRQGPDYDITNEIFTKKLACDSFISYVIKELYERFGEDRFNFEILSAEEKAGIEKIVFEKIEFRNRERMIKSFANYIKNSKVFKAFSKKFQEYEVKSIMLLRNSIPERTVDMYPLTRLMKRHFLLHVGPTNSGKTYQSIEKLKKSKKGVYLAPLRLLAYEIYDKLNEAGVACDMLTGEEAIQVPDATHVSSTIEMLDELEEYDIAVIDEGQNVGDVARGGAWTKAILGVRAKEVHICSDDSCVELLVKMIEQCNDSYEIIYHERMTKLILDRSFVRFPEDVRDRDAYIVFSKKSVMAVASDLQKKGIAASILYGNLPYDVRLNEVRRFMEGITKVIVATDAIGMGVNLPIKRVVFLETKKYDGISMRKLRATEIKQIAGRAGRRGMFSTGFYSSEFGKSFIDKAMQEELPKVEKARVNFPESLVELDMPLSELLRKWYDIPDEEMYLKSILEDDLELCKELEVTISDKQLIYKCITIAFDSRNKRLHALFLLLANAQNKDYDSCKESIRSIVEMNSVMFDSYMDEMSLDDLGEQYSVYDLLYAFLRKFQHDEYLDIIMELKRDCSKKMMHILQTEELVGKICPECGKALKWNYPYKLCQSCFDKKYYP